MLPNGWDSEAYVPETLLKAAIDQIVSSKASFEPWWFTNSEMFWIKTIGSLPYLYDKFQPIIAQTVLK